VSSTAVAEASAGPAEAPVLELAPPANLEVPRVLPVSSLSKSSIELFERCPEAWKRKYIDEVREPGSGAMSAGKAAGAALAAYFNEKRDSREPSADEVVERFDAELALELKSAVLKEKEDRKRLTEGGREAVRIYIETIAGPIAAVATERELRLQFPGAEWSVVGYIDLETEADEVIDYKLKKPGGRHVSEAEAETDIQATLYLLGRALEGRPAAGGFTFHSGLSHEPQDGERWRMIAAPRSERQLANFQARIALVARMIARAVATGDWGYRTEGWFCSEGFCPAWKSCPAGGLR
jgi:RecB family exonuclease